jgi:acyl-CoA hydrolase
MTTYKTYIEPSDKHPYVGFLDTLYFDNPLVVGNVFELNHTSTVYRTSTWMKLEVQSVTEEQYSTTGRGEITVKTLDARIISRF